MKNIFFIVLLFSNYAIASSTFLVNGELKLYQDDLFGEVISEGRVFTIKSASVEVKNCKEGLYEVVGNQFGGIDDQYIILNFECHDKVEIKASGLSQFEGYYRAIQKEPLLVKKVNVTPGVPPLPGGVISSCSEAQFKGSILEIRKEDNKLKFRKRYEYLQFPFDLNDSKGRSFAFQNFSFDLTDFSGKSVETTNHQYKENTTEARAYETNKVTLKENKLQIRKILVPKVIGSFFKITREELNLNLIDDNLNVRIATGGFSVFGLRSKGSDCDYVRVTKDEYVQLAADLGFTELK